MKYYPYPSIQTTRFTRLLKCARYLAFLSFIGFYLVLFIAAASYFNLDFEQRDQGVVSLTAINQLLMNGIVSCLIGLAISRLLAWFVSLPKNAVQVQA